jgi:hypothetical protein
MKKKIKPKIPNPGSDEALDLGCTCPVMDNGHGKGYMKIKKQLFFVIQDNCPIHNTLIRKKDKK